MICESGNQRGQLFRTNLWCGQNITNVLNISYKYHYYFSFERKHLGLFFCCINIKLSSIEPDFSFVCFSLFRGLTGNSLADISSFATFTTIDETIFMTIIHISNLLHENQTIWAARTWFDNTKRFTSCQQKTMKYVINLM